MGDKVRAALPAAENAPFSASQYQHKHARASVGARGFNKVAAVFERETLKSANISAPEA